MQGAPLPFPFPLEQEEILRRRAAILAALLKSDEGFCAVPVRRISTQTLVSMLDMYDKLFFGGLLRRKLACLTVTLSPRLTSSAGKFLCTKGAFGRIRNAEVRMSSDFLFRLTQGPFLLNGLAVSTPQEAFLVVFEHELCHAAETLLYGRTGHSQRFMALANGLFGHTAARHSLPTRRQEAAEEGLTLGAQVRFLYRGNIKTGVIQYIGKAATVMSPSPDGDYRDRYGQRYTKYRVPLKQLQKME